MNWSALDSGILVPALIAGLLVLATHIPLGAQVLDRGIVFIDLAIAQIATLGVDAELLEAPPSAAACFAAAGLSWGWLARSDGQASVELLAAVPIMLAITLAAAQVLAAGLCRELAGEAAGAGAAALLQSRDPQAAARRALPGWSRGQLRVTRRGRELRVAINPPSLVPGLARLLSVEAHADAGPPA